MTPGAVMTPTINEVLNNNALLLKLAAEVLNPGPFEHSPAYRVEPGWGIVELPYCRKCKGELVGDCPVGYPETRPMEVVASELVRKVCDQDNGYLRLTSVVLDVMRGPEQKKLGLCPDVIGWWWKQSPSQQAACALAALSKVQIGERQ